MSVNLLPKSHQEFSHKEYWNTFFKKRGNKAFEWYGEYHELCGQLHKYVKSKDHVLMVGCGNSTLSADLYDVGYTQITNIDISPVAIKQMTAANKEKRADMKFIQMDAMNMSFGDGEFSVVIDKGTLDALMPDNTEEVSAKIDKFFSEVSRVLKLGGRYICVTLLQDHILKKLLDSFYDQNHLVRIARCHEAEQKAASGGESNIMPVFVVVITKFNKLPQLVLEVCMGGEKMQRLSSTSEAIDIIRSAQQASLVTNGLSNNPLSENDEINLDLFKPGDDNPRYTVFVLDQKGTRRSGQFATFIVPQGRETDWLFSTSVGRKKLQTQAGFKRLAVVIMHRDQKYDSLDTVKEELCDSVKSLAPKGITGQIPYLSLGSDVGKRNVIHRGFSDISGEFVVEDVSQGISSTFRRLIFLKTQFLVQSEARLKPISKSGNKLNMIIDHSYLACSHHIYMTIGVQLALQALQDEQSSAKTAVIGLGGGALCAFLHRCFSNLTVTAIDIDPVIFDVAKQFFSLSCDQRLEVIIQDGLRFLKESAEKGEKYDAILFDVDSKDTSLGMSCPPKAFLELETLDNVKKSLTDKGFFVLNLVCRDDNIKKPLLQDVKKHFSTVASYQIEEEVNEIFFCTNGTSSEGVDMSKQLEKAVKVVNAKAAKTKLQSEQLVDVYSLLDSLKII